MYEENLSRLVSFLESWNNGGAYYGPVIHRLNSARLFRIHETEWTQSAMIEGYLNLFANTKEKNYLRKAIEIAKNDIKKFNRAESTYRYAGHEDDRFKSLVHCSLANCSLLRLHRYVDDILGKRIIDTVTANISNYLIKRLWNEEFGGFTFSRTDFYSRKQDRFVINMNAVALKSFVMFERITGDKRYRDRINRLIKWICSAQISSKNKTIDGAVPYQVPEQFKGETNSVSIYSGLTLSALCYCHKSDYSSAKITEFNKKLYNHLLAFYNAQNGLFYHTYKKGLVKKPYFIAGASFVLKGLDDYEKAYGKRSKCIEYAERINKYQMSNGAYPNFKGYNSNGNNRVEMAVDSFEDYAPTTSFNAHMFEFLSRFTKKKVKKRRYRKLMIAKPSFTVIDSKKLLLVISIFPCRSFALFLYYKKFNYPLMNISYYSFMNLIKKEILRK